LLITTASSAAHPHFSTAVHNLKANPVLRIFKGRNRDGMCPARTVTKT
jgi:hypothetical protein